LFKFHALQVIDSAIIRLDTPTKQDAFQHSLNAKARYSRCATGTVFCKYFQLLIMDIVPVVQGGMQWVGYAELASAVSNAGGLGLVRRIRLNESPNYMKYLTLQSSSQPSPNQPPKTSAKKSADAAP
jgi:hypothetical protein